MTTMENTDMECTKIIKSIGDYFSPDGKCWWIDNQFGYRIFYIDIQMIKKRLRSRLSERNLFESFEFNSFICINRDLKKGLIYKPLCETYTPQKHSIWIPLADVYSNKKFKDTIQKKFPDIEFI